MKRNFSCQNITSIKSRAVLLFMAFQQLKTYQLLVPVDPVSAGWPGVIWATIRGLIKTTDFSFSKGPSWLQSWPQMLEEFSSRSHEQRNDWGVCPVLLTKVYWMQSGIPICDCLNPLSLLFTQTQPTTYHCCSNTCWLWQHTCVGEFSWPTFYDCF